MLTICVLTESVLGAPASVTSLERFRASSGPLPYNSDNDANEDDVDGAGASAADAAAASSDGALWRKSLLSVPPAQLRWRTPCAGSDPAPGIQMDGLFEAAAMAPSEHFSIIALKAMEQHGKVSSLMSKYVSDSDRLIFCAFSWRPTRKRYSDYKRKKEQKKGKRKKYAPQNMFGNGHIKLSWFLLSRFPNTPLLVWRRLETVRQYHD